MSTVPTPCARTCAQASTESILVVTLVALLCLTGVTVLGRKLSRLWSTAARSLDAGKPRQDPGDALGLAWEDGTGGTLADLDAPAAPSPLVSPAATGTGTVAAAPPPTLTPTSTASATATATATPAAPPRTPIPDRARAGARVVAGLRPQIRGAASEFAVPADALAAILMHESQAGERDWTGPLADSAERAEAKLRGLGDGENKASTGVGQLQVRHAERLRAKYPGLATHADVVDDLLDPAVATRYVAARLAELNDQLDTYLRIRGLSVTPAERSALLAIGYQIGWDSLQNRNLADPALGKDVPSRIAELIRRNPYVGHTVRHGDYVRQVLDGADPDAAAQGR